MPGLVCVLLAASTAPPILANMGATHWFRFDWTPSSANLHWVSLPLLYSPTTAEGLCLDLGGATGITEVHRWDEATSRFVVHVCGGATPFALIKGMAYGIVNASGVRIEAVVAGSHDDAFVYTLAPTAGSNLTWVSLPYHLKLPEVAGTPTGADAEDLCRSIGLSEVLAIVSWDETPQAFVTYACGSTLDTPFGLEVGEGYGLINRPGQTITWQPPHW